MEVEKFQHAGLMIRIEQDQDPESPREWDNLGTMVCFHRRYRLGDKHTYGLQEAQDTAKKIEKDGGIVLPLYLYDHSGITMRTTSFSCPWDSGQVGIIWIEADKIRKEYSVQRISKKLRERVTGYLVSEVGVYDQYLTGDVYGFIVEDENGEHLDSCWGHFGLDYCKQAAKESAEHEAKGVAEKKIQYGVEHNA
jgi:hypothetical protein